MYLAHIQGPGNFFVTILQQSDKAESESVPLCFLCLFPQMTLRRRCSGIHHRPPRHLKLVLCCLWRQFSSSSSSSSSDGVLIDSFFKRWLDLTLSLSGPSEVLNSHLWTLLFEDLISARKPTQSLANIFIVFFFVFFLNVLFLCLKWW